MPFVCDPSLWTCLRHPCRQIQALEAAPPSFRRLPAAAWSGLTLIAVLGSALYGASLSLVLPQWRPGAGALWMAISAGLGWCVFGPVLVLWVRRNAFVCAHACLVTMAYGEAVLVTGAGINALLATDVRNVAALAGFNLAWVGTANVVMALALARQLHALRVPVWKTLLAWMLVLNGSGAFFFWALQRRLR